MGTAANAGSPTEEIRSTAANPRGMVNTSISNYGPDRRSMIAAPVRPASISIEQIFPPLFSISTVQALDIFGESLVTTVCVRVIQSE